MWNIKFFAAKKKKNVENYREDHKQELREQSKQLVP